MFRKNFHEIFSFRPVFKNFEGGQEPVQGSQEPDTPFIWSGDMFLSTLARNLARVDRFLARVARNLSPLGFLVLQNKIRN